ncbi:MAG TPA: NAD-dependent malic enzyme [Acidimicrobiales bacterium]|nr:NAD-dependent malic enzyme [Acidimicrobiales bacterium]
MPTPSISYSISIRVEIDHSPGSLGRLTSTIGQAGGNILGVDLVEVSSGRMTRDVTVLCTDAEHAAHICRVVAELPGVRVIEALDRTFAMHLNGKIEVRSKFPLRTRDDLSMAYTPGVARVCRSIEAMPEEVYRYTIKANTVAVVTDGTAVLGLGDIGPAAALPVMEGKAMLFKEFAGVDAFPICLDVSSADELVETVVRLAPVFGGINLEDIAAPRCFEVEERLKGILDIPVFHDDQHGTAVVVLAALSNASRVVGKTMSQLRVVIAGMGAAGIAVAKILHEAGVADIVGVDRQGAIHQGRGDLVASKRWIADNTNAEGRKGSLADVMAGADVFVGVSGPGLITSDDLRTMAERPIVFALANPDPEILPEEAEGIVAVMATGRSDFANQINNVLCFPGIFRGALDSGATAITERMKLAAATAIANSVPSDELSPTYIIPSVLDRSVAPRVAATVAEAAGTDGVVRPMTPSALTTLGDGG